MTGSLGDAAAGWFALASRLLGWRPAEFWNATPAELRTALASPDEPHTAWGEYAPPDRETIARMMERDAHD